MANKTVYPYGTGGTLPSGIGIVNDLVTGGVDAALAAEQGKVIGGKIEEYDKVVDDLYGEEHESEIAINFGSASLYRISMDADTFYYSTQSSKVYRAYCIPIPEGSERFVLTPNSSTNPSIFISKTQLATGTYSGSTVASTYMATGCEGFTPNNNSAYRMTIPRSGGAVTIRLSSNAKYLYIQKNFNDTSIDCTPASLVFYKTYRDGGKLDSIGESSNGIYDGISFVLGTLDSNGKVVSNNTHLVSNPVPKNAGYYLSVNSAYKIESVALFDNSGKCVNRKYFVPITGYVNKTSNFGRNVCVAGFYVRFVLEKVSGTASLDDNIVNSFVLLNDERMKRVMLDTPKFQLFHERIKALTKVTWKALSKVPAPWIYNETYFEAGSVNIGIPYSEVGEHNKYVGMNVSLRTFLTALLNPRSVMYTENVSGESPSSKYGISYHNYEEAAAPYYGTVCSGLTAYAIGLPEIITSELYGAGKIPGETAIAKGDQNNNFYIKQNDSWVVATADDIVQLVQPMDVIKSPGHVSTISDIYTDEYGNRKFIVWCEEGRAEVTVAKSRPLTISSFISKLNGYASSEGWTLLRYTELDGLVAVQSDRDVIPMEWYEYPKNLSIDPDICTFAGDYVAFQIGDPNDTINNNKAFLNIHRNKGVYDTLQIFAESANESTDSPVATVDISANSGTFIYNSTNIFANDVADKNDWIVVDLKQLPTALTHGKYKARVIKSGGSAASGFTHFQMVDVNFTVTGTAISDLVCHYSSEEATPYYIRRERLDGLGAHLGSTSYQRVIPEGETSCTNPRNWAISSTNRYVKVFFRADYGTAVKRIDVYGQFNS